jgi:hypothetical protein
MKYSIILLCVVIFSCHAKIVDNKNHDDFQKIDYTLLQGFWAEKKNDNVLIQIKEDSIYFFEDDEPVYFKVENDTMKILIDGYFYQSYILKLTRDSLVRIEYEDTVKFFRKELL